MGCAFMMHLYRITHRRHGSDLSGEGSRLYGGRWNSLGKRVVYTAESCSLSVCESLVHFNSSAPPANMVCTRMDFPEELVRDGQLCDDYQQFDFLKENSQKAGDEWIGSCRTVGLIVPSVVIPTEFNILLNPMHPDISKIKIVSISDFNFDFRLLKFS
jgi:RES domain-containing protein